MIYVLKYKEENQMNYIPVDRERAKQFEEKMGRNLLYRSTDNFMTIYNNNLINKSNDEIDTIAREITETYKNISLLNRKFIIKSNEEVISEEFEVLFPHIAFVATLKRIAQDIIDDNYPEDTLMVFTEQDVNVVQVYDPTSEELIHYEGAERLRNANRAISTNPFLINNVEIHPYGEDGEGIAFKAIDVLRIDTSFINDIGELLESYLE